jgi:chromosome segregation ATPase
MQDNSPEQNAQLSVWAGQRDAILSEIAVLRTEKESLTRSNKELAASNTDLETRINQILGRISELDKQEAEQVYIMSTDLASQKVEKAALEGDAANLRKEIITLQTSKNLLTETIASATDIYEKVFGRAKVLDEVVDHVTRVSGQNLRDVEMLLGTVKNSVQQVIDVNTENVSKTNRVIEELPKIFFDVQRFTPVKRPIKL